MIFYKRHIGDYAAATRHLSLLEHGVYCMLLDIYYTSERALPVDTRAVQRLVGARSKDERDGAFCAYCGATDVPLELDHIHPRSRGGADSPDNLTPACKRCNTSKGAKTLDEWGFR